MNEKTIHRRRFLKTTLGASFAGAAALAGAEGATADRRGAGRELNAKIQKARDVALDILKPTPAQLEHGLELHANALVFDAYGFAPRAAIDGEVFARAMEAGASNIELEDMREDMYMTRCVTDDAERREFLDAWAASGVTCIFQNAGEEGQDPLRLIKRLARFTYVTDSLRDLVRKAVTPEDIVAAKEDRKHCIYFSGNGVPLTQQWISTQDELRYVRIFYQLGIRMMHLTYNRRNMIGDGCAETSNAGLSDFGREVVAELNRLGIVVDIAHSSWKTSLEAAELSRQPVVASHSTCAGLYHHFRGKPDEVLRAIADGGGYIGICCIPRFLGGKGDIAVLLDHVDYAVRRFGIDHVAIGTDVVYSSRNQSAERKKLPRAGPSRTRWAALWPPDAYKTTARARESLAWTNWPLFTVGLVQRGYSDHAILKIIGGNALRVAKAVWRGT